MGAILSYEMNTTALIDDGQSLWALSLSGAVSLPDACAFFQGWTRARPTWRDSAASRS